MFRQWLVCCWTCSVIAYSSAARAAAEGRRYRSSSPGGQVRARQGGREESTCAGNGTWRSAYQPLANSCTCCTWPPGRRKWCRQHKVWFHPGPILLPGVPPHFLTDPDLSEWCDLETIHCLCNPGHGPPSHPSPERSAAERLFWPTQDSAGTRLKGRI